MNFNLKDLGKFLNFIPKKVKRFQNWNIQNILKAKDLQESKDLPRKRIAVRKFFKAKDLGKFLIFILKKK